MKVKMEQSQASLLHTYSVKLETFEGPLDLLLHLIKKNEVDIHDIPIYTITRQYLEYIKMMKELNLEVAGEFLVMAATLIQIKSKTLLPPEPDEENAEEEQEDPRAELVRRLLEYQKYKEAALLLDSRTLLGREVFARTFPPPDLDGFEPEEEEPEVGLFELLKAFQQVLAKVPAETFHEVEAETLSIADRMTEILDLLQGKENIEFDALFPPESLRRDFVIVTFLAVLELCRLKTIRIVQNSRYGSIWIIPAVVETATPLTEDSFGYTGS